MDHSQRYAELLMNVLRQIERDRGHLEGVKIRSVCDVEAGQFLIIATGWKGQSWHNDIMFHAWLKGGRVIVEENNFEKMMDDLLEAGIAEADIWDAEDVAELERSDV